MENDAATAHSLAFDTFLPALLKEQEGVAAAAAAAATARVSTAEESSTVSEGLSLKSNKGCCIVPENVADTMVTNGGGGREEGVTAGENGTSGDPTTTTSERRGISGEMISDTVGKDMAAAASLWRPPFLAGRWPVVLSISPDSARASPNPDAPAPLASIFSSVGASRGARNSSGSSTSNCATDGRNPQKDENASGAVGLQEPRGKAAAAAVATAGQEDRNNRNHTHDDGACMAAAAATSALKQGLPSAAAPLPGHRVLIVGRNFAHPSLDSTRPSSAVKHGNGAGTMFTRERRDNDIVSMTSLENDPQNTDSGATDTCTGSTGQRRVGVGGGSRSSHVREVFVSFGRDVVQGEVLSDTLIEAYAPARSKPGFVEVAVVVAGKGPGGALSSAARMPEKGGGCDG